MKTKINRPDFYDGDKVITLSASVKSGEVTKSKSFKFLIRKANRTPSQALAEDVKHIKKSIPSLVKADIDIMKLLTMPCGSTVVWSVNEDTNLKPTGIVIRPDFGSPSEDATITAVVTNGEETETITIPVTIMSMTEEDELDVISRKITWELIKGENIDRYRITSKLNLSETIDEVPVSWSSSDIRFIASDGTVNRPEYTESDAQVTLTATLTKNAKTKQVILNGLKVLKKSASSAQRCEEYVNNENELLHWVTANGTNENESLSSVVDNFVLPAENDDMLLTWSVVNSTGEAIVNNYFKVEYVDDSVEENIVKAEQARRYTATVTRNEANNVTAYLKSVASVSETEIDGTVVPGGSASKIWQVVILKSGEVKAKEVTSLSSAPMTLTGSETSFDEVDFSTMRLSRFDFDSTGKGGDKTEYEEMLISTNAGRATWSIEKHREAMRKLNEELEAKKAANLVE